MKKRKNIAPTEAAKSVAALGKNPNRFYVYALWIVGEGKPFYIGKGQGDRCYTHFSASSLKADTFKNRIIKKATQEGREIYIQILHENLDEGTALDYEVWWIDHYGRRNVRKDGCLANLTDGGEGTSGWVMPSEVRLKIAASNIGKTHSVETKALLSAQRTISWTVPSYRAAQEAERRERAQAPGFSERMRTISTNAWSDPDLVDRQSRMMAECWKDVEFADRLSASRVEMWTRPGFRENHSAKVRTPESVIATMCALRNPLFTLETPHIRPSISVFRCRFCGGTFEAKHTRISKGMLPRPHRKCAVSAFSIDQGTRVYAQGRGMDLADPIFIEPPSGVEFTFKFARAGVIFFGPDGSELSRVRLPPEYTAARIHGERLLSGMNL